MLRKIMTFSCTMLLAAAVHAASPSDASLTELLTLTRADQMTTQAMSAVEQSMRQTMQMATQGEKLNAAQQQTLERVRSKYMQIMREEMSWDRLQPLYLQIYRESLTQEEVDGMIAFYKTPAGQALITKMPVIMQKSMSVMQDQMMPRLIARLKEAQQELAASNKPARRP